MKGYKLVPVEPTEHQMKIARSMTMQQEQTVGAEYRAMLAAAPTPPQPIYDEAKERELFEIHYRAEYEANSGNELSEWAIKSMRDGTGYGASRHYLNGQWAGWKACAQSRAKSMGDPQ